MSDVDTQTEKTRNRLLRRADWRFLLPDPSPAKSICYAAGLLRSAVALISRDIVSAKANAVGDCDLAVAVNPDEATLQAAWAALRPGGSLYTEWYSLRSGGLNGVRQRVETTGFADAACYWPWPWPDRALTQFWLPLEAPNLLEYFLRSRAPVRGPGQGLIYRMRRAVFQLVVRLGLAFPICVTARKPLSASNGRDSNRSPDRLAYLQAHWSQWGFDRTSGRSSLLLLTGGQRSINKVIALIAAAGDNQPRVVVKLPRVLESMPALEREATVLRTLQAQHPNGLSGVPRIVGTWGCDNFAGLVETVLRGQPLYTQLRRSNYRELALKATDWLIELAGVPRPQPRAEWWDRLVQPRLEEFEASFNVVIDHNRWQQSRAFLNTLDDLPLVCEQRDYAPWNVLIDHDAALVVLDWESAELQGLPAIDLIYFLTYLAFFIDGAMESKRFREAYRAMLNPQTFTGRIAAECQQRYIHRLGLAARVLHPLRLLTWLIHSQSEYERLSADAAGQPTAEALRQSLFVGLWEEELLGGSGES